MRASLNSAANGSDFRGSEANANLPPRLSCCRNTPAKPEVWADLKKVMALLGLKPPKPGQRGAARA